jgi:hypothetical protein
MELPRRVVSTWACDERERAKASVHEVGEWTESSDDEDNSEDEEMWMEQAGRACTFAADRDAGLASQPSSLAVGAGSWLKSSLEWVLQAAPGDGDSMQRRSEMQSGHLRRPQGLVRTSCQVHPPHRGVRHTVNMGGEKETGPVGGPPRLVQITPPARSPAGPKKDRARVRSIEAACNGRWFSRLSPILLVGRKPHSVKDLVQLKGEGVSTLLSVLEVRLSLWAAAVFV